MFLFSNVLHEAGRLDAEVVQNRRKVVGDGFELSRAETRTEMLSRSIEFIDRQIGQTSN